MVEIGEDRPHDQARPAVAHQLRRLVHQRRGRFGRCPLLTPAAVHRRHQAQAGPFAPLDVERADRLAAAAADGFGGEYLAAGLVRQLDRNLARLRPLGFPAQHHQRGPVDIAPLLGEHIFRARRGVAVLAGLHEPGRNQLLEPRAEQRLEQPGALAEAFEAPFPEPAGFENKQRRGVADYFEATPYRTGSNQIWSIHWDRGLACLAATKNNAAPIA